jgi:GxxExxY protein
VEEAESTSERYPPIPDELDRTAKEVVDAAYKVHSALGPGLTEAAYEVCLCHELRRRGIRFKSQVAMPIAYEGVKLDAGMRFDPLVEDQLIVEIKAVEKITALFEAQLMTYLKLSGLRLGLLINFNVPLIRDGIRRMVR